MIITGNNFAEELDLKRSAYPYSIKDEPAAYNDMVVHLVKMLSEEIVLLSAANDLGIVVTDEELNTAVARFKEDYPEDSFEQILLKNAVSYPFWLKRFKNNMIVEKLIDQELKNKIQITSEDIVTFYNRLKARQDPKSDDMPQDTVDNEKELVKKLKMHKTQEQYTAWVGTLVQQYPVQINEEELKKYMIDDQNVKEDEE